MKLWCDSEMLSQYQSPALKLPQLRVLAARASSRRQVIVKNYSDPLHPSGWAHGYSSLWSRKRSKVPRCGSALLAVQTWLNKGIREFRRVL